MAGDASQRGLLVDDLATMMLAAAEVLERAAADTGLVPISADFTIEGDDRNVALGTPAELAMADQRTAIDRIAAALGVQSRTRKVLTGHYGQSAEGYWKGVQVIAITNAGLSHRPPSDSAPSTRALVGALREIIPWAASVEEHVVSLSVCGHHDCPFVLVTACNESAADRLLEGLTQDPDHKQRYGPHTFRAVLPTGHLLTGSNPMRYKASPS